MYNILIVDDEPNYCDLLDLVEQKTFVFNKVSSCEEMKNYLKNNPLPDLILMDWDLKQESGVEIVNELKSQFQTSTIPMVMLTGRILSEDMVEALEKGADDYITKPFELNVLFARIKSNLRKYSANKKENQKCIKNFHFNKNNLTVEFNGKRVSLKQKEFEIVQILVSNPEKVFSRGELNTLTTGQNVYVSKRTVDTYINYIRNKFKGVDLIVTVPKMGYRLNTEVLK